MKTIDEIRAAFLRVHHYAMGDKGAAYMSIPADPKRDSDLIVSAAIDELGELRGQVEALRDGAEVATLKLGAESQRLRERVAELERERDEARAGWLAAQRQERDFFSTSCANKERAEKAERERDAARVEAAMLREALKTAEFERDIAWHDGPPETVETMAHELAKARAEAEAVRAALVDLTAAPGDWQAARDRALAERVREVVLGKPMNLPKDNAAWCTSCLENVQTAVEVRANALDLDALVGGKS